MRTTVSMNCMNSWQNRCLPPRWDERHPRTSTFYDPHMLVEDPLHSIPCLPLQILYHFKFESIVKQVVHDKIMGYYIELEAHFNWLI